MTTLRLYRTYSFRDKDPIIDEVRTLVEEEGLLKKLNIVHELSGVSTSTLDNWFNGTTISPQNRTVSAVVTSLGYQRRFTKTRDIELEKELKLAKAWNEKQRQAEDEAKRRVNARKKRKQKEKQREQQRLQA